MAAGKNQLIISASLLCLLGGCASGKHASLEIRSINDSAVGVEGERSIERGKQLLERGQNADAISAFRTALREDANKAEAHNGLAIAYDRIGRKDLARRYFELAVAEKPEEQRYRSNLARYFVHRGQPELADGLLTVPTKLAEASEELKSASPDIPSDAIAAIEIADQQIAIAGKVDPIEAILADLSSSAFPLAEPVPDQDEARSAIVETIVPKTPSFAVQRPATASAIEAVAISLPRLPVPSRRPFEDQIELVADLPRNERRQAETQGPHIERISLGEVRLVTLPLAAPQKAAFEFQQLGDKLALWADEEKRRSQFEGRAGLKGRLAVQDAIQRAAMDDVINSAAQLASLVEQIDKDFVYLAFEDDSSAEGPIDI